MQASVLVIGSLNMDLVTRAERLPRPGETLKGDRFATVPGGKGANQALAAVRLGASVAMVGCVGEDGYGEQLRNALQGAGVDCSGVTAADGVSTGVALIVVDASSQNAIVVVAGANGELTSRRVECFDHLIQQARVVICQLEIPSGTVEYALQRARALGKTVILNPAPASGPLPVSWYSNIDYLIPNESEAAALTGVAVCSLETAKVAAGRLLELGVRKVIITMGEQGALFVGSQCSEHFAARKVQAVDTTAAGDTFVGAFAAALSVGKGEREAIEFGQIAASLSVTRAGAQPSIPTLAEVVGVSGP